MAQFQFKLDGVLRHRELIEQQRQRELAEAQAELRKAEDVLRGISADIDANGRDLRDNHLVGRLDLAFLAGHRRYVAAMHRRAQGLVQQLTLQHQRVDKARLAVSEAARERKIMEKLRERQAARWTEDQARRETAALDEVSMQMALSNLAEAEEFHEGTPTPCDDKPGWLKPRTTELA